MIIRVPLILEKSYAIIRRLDIAATTTATPYTGITSGYDKDFREPVPYDTSGANPTRTDARTEMAEIRVPCQVEMVSTEDLQQFPSGDSPDTNMRLIFHKIDLRRLSLINTTTNQLLLKVNDRIPRIETRTPGTIAYTFKDPGVYIFELQPGSYGFGPDGFDLYIVYLSNRIRGVNR